MTPSGQTICLSMIVKNEAHVIRRCLASVRPIIDYWVIVDTGSTDGTQDVIAEAMAGLPGTVIDRPWQDFAHNRSEALALARPHADYSLIIDADDELLLEPGFSMPALGADAYLIDIQDQGSTYRRIQLVRNTQPWRYVGVLHEFLKCDSAGDAMPLKLAMRRNHDGARRRDPSTYAKDATILERALATETDPHLVARYTFYLAQSYRDSGQTEAALDAYLRRADLGFWDQEVYYSLYQAGRLMQSLGRAADDVLAIYQRASAVCPLRAEAAHAASRLARETHQYRRGFELAQPAIGLVASPDHLFVETWVYAYGALDEYAVNAYWAGDYRACAEACRTLLSRPDVPAPDRARTQANLDFALAKLEPVADERRSSWRPNRPLGGTELMVEGLRSRLGRELDRIDLHINAPGQVRAAGKPLVVWVHHDVDQAAVQWMSDRAAVAGVAQFVFVSYWQRERYLRVFGLSPERCVVLRNATAIKHAKLQRRTDGPLAVAYTSTPFRGLSVLLDAWQIVAPENATLHIWSSMALYGPGSDDANYRSLFARASAMKGVRYEGLLANDVLKERLRSIDILAYPSTFPETSCLSVIEAMAAGCRVICPSLGALPETTFNFARVYAAPDDATEHAAIFAQELAAELALPWNGASHLGWQQQDICHAFYDWDKRVLEWRDLIRRLAD